MGIKSMNQLDHRKKPLANILGPEKHQLNNSFDTYRLETMYNQSAFDVQTKVNHLAQ
jgi:hypothetical protein